MAFRNVFSPAEEYKLVILVRNDLKMGKGKIGAQVGHAAVECALHAEKKDKKAFETWMRYGQAKIVLKVDDLDQLNEYIRLARADGLHVSTITDAGRTQIEPGTMTCAGIGPAPVSALDKVTGELKML